MKVEQGAHVHSNRELVSSQELPDRGFGGREFFGGVARADPPFIPLARGEEEDGAGPDNEPERRAAAEQFRHHARSFGRTVKPSARAASR